MAVTVPYIEPEELQRAIGGDRTTNFERYERAVAAATRQIDRWTGRRFLRDAQSSTRLFRANSCERVRIGDFTDPASVTVETDDLGDGTWSPWGPSEWRAEADDLGNGRLAPLDGEPWRWIAATGTRKFPTCRPPWGLYAYGAWGLPTYDGAWGFPTYGAWGFPTYGACGLTTCNHQPRVRATTRWGWADPPDPVLEACMHLATAYFQSKDRAQEVMYGDPVTLAQGLVMDYAVEGGTLFCQPMVG